ncbi:hypothetical protein ACIPM2_01670 [Streptomyces sp. NPDC086081]|jgi:hypothetical protein|uniref:hypothetical protein n=1 Tax=Streptomyces sp. NPDC086081 TaxID=3365749 RepID=UPI0038021161
MTNAAEGLAVEQYPDLNREFYSSDPVTYFRNRYYLLLLAASKADQLDQLLANGVSYEGITAQSELTEPTDEDERLHQAFLITEAEVLLHHASEALLRLYFAHEDLPECPWLEIARLTKFSEFKRRVAQLRDHSIPREHIGRIFLGSVPDQHDDERQLLIGAIERLLRIVARRTLEDAHLYNSSKHGLAVVSGPASLTITSDQTGASFDSSGPSISFLELSGDRTKWCRTTRWLPAQQSLWLTNLVITEMRALWEIARARYTEVEISGVDAIRPEALNELQASAAPVRRVSMPLKYYQQSEQG